MGDLVVCQDSEDSVEAWVYLEVRVSLEVKVTTVTIVEVVTRKTALPKVKYVF